MTKSSAGQVPVRLRDMFDTLPLTDTVKVIFSNGVVNFNRRYPDGRVQSVRMRANRSYRQTTLFDPRDVTIQERRELVAALYNSGLSQSEIADQLGVSQATISLDLRKNNKY